MERRTITALLAAGAMIGCTASGTGAGRGLSAVPQGGTTTHGQEPDRSRATRTGEDDVAAMLLTPRVHFQPYDPEPEMATADGLVFRTRIDVTNRGGVAVRVPAVDLDVEMRMGNQRRGCELLSIATLGPPVVAPGETVMLEARSECPASDAPYEVVSLVALPGLAGDDGLSAGRTMVLAEASPTD